MLLALLATVGGYLQEKGRLAQFIQMSPAAARDLYEKAQLRRERVMMVVTGVLVAGAVAALVRLQGVSDDDLVVRGAGDRRGRHAAPRTPCG